MLFLELFFSFYTKHNLFLLSKTNILGIHDIVLTRILSNNDEKTAGIKTLNHRIFYSFFHPNKSFFPRLMFL